jgi:hypothetical protein
MENKQLEESPSSDNWISFKREVVSCIGRPCETTGPFLFQKKTVNNRNYHDMFDLFSVLKMAHLQPNVSFIKMVPLHTGDFFFIFLKG